MSSTEYQNKIVQSDCLEYLDKLDERTADCVILDPPYFKVVNEKWDKQWKSIEDYLSWMENIIEKISRVSKHNCSFWLFGFPYQLSFIIPLM